MLQSLLISMLRQDAFSRFCLSCSTPQNFWNKWSNVGSVDVVHIGLLPVEFFAFLCY